MKDIHYSVNTNKNSKQQVKIHFDCVLILFHQFSCIFQLLMIIRHAEILRCFCSAKMIYEDSDTPLQ